MDIDDIKNRATFHPATPEKLAVYEENRVRALDYALWINEVAPDSPEKSVAIRKLLDDVAFSVNAAVARHS